MTPGYFSSKHSAQVDSTFYVIWKIRITSVSLIFFEKRCINYKILGTARRALQGYKLFFEKKIKCTEVISISHFLSSKILFWRLFNVERYPLQLFLIYGVMWDFSWLNTSSSRRAIKSPQHRWPFELSSHPILKVTWTYHYVGIFESNFDFEFCVFRSVRSKNRLV